MGRNLFQVFLLSFGLCFCTQTTVAQAYGYDFTNPQRTKVRIPFKKINNLIIISVRVNDRYDLNFILDTGVRHTLILKRSYTDSLGVAYGKKFRLFGADKESFVEAQLALGLTLDLPEIRAIHQTVLVLDEDYFDLDNSIGLPIHGILGMDIFLRFTIKIDYERQILTIQEPSTFKPRKSYNTLPILLDNGKPYLQAVIVLENRSLLDAVLLMDSGASLSLMLDMTSDPLIRLPERHLYGNFGQVLGGELETYIGRVEFLGFAPHSFYDVITNFQIPFLRDSTSINNGIVGAGIMSRFDVICDFVNQRLFLRKNGSYYRPFVRDRSGLQIRLKSKNFNQIVITDVLKGSPAQFAGLQSGDEILSCNGRPSESLQLSELTEIFQGDPETLIRLVISRNGQTLKFKFYLKDLI